MAAKSPDLKELLRLSFSAPVAWLAGEAHSQRLIHWVALGLPEAQPGDLVLLSASELTGQVIQQAQESGLAALLCLGAARLPQGANPGELVIAAVDEPAADLRSLQRTLLTILINQHAALMERGVRVRSQLSQLEAEGKGLEGLVKAMAELSGCGVLVQDKRGRILAHHASSTLASIWSDVVEQLAGLGSLPDNLTDRKLAVSQAKVTSQPLPGGLERLVAPLIVGEMARGYLSLVGLQGELDELDTLVIEQGSPVCAMEMARNKAIREAEKRLKGDLLTALLQDNLSPREARLWVQTMGLDLAQAHAALRFAWEGPTPPSRRRLETMLNGEIAHLGLQVITSSLGSEVICFCQVPPEKKRPEPALALGQAVLQQTAQEFPNVQLRCGIGLPVSSLEEWRSSLRQAGQALEMARRLREGKPLYYADLSVYRLLFQLEHSPELISFEQETLGKLLVHEGAAELLRTLEAFFEHNGNLSQAAEALFIHRNTLLYRLERIAALTDLDLELPENRLAIQLALRIYHMIGKHA